MQINGKLRGRLTLPSGLSREEARTLLSDSELVQRFVGSREVRSFVFVPDRLVNIVISAE